MNEAGEETKGCLNLHREKIKIVKFESKIKITLPPVLAKIY